MRKARQAFVAKRGWEPGPDDLLFPEMPYPEHLKDMKAAARSRYG